MSKQMEAWAPELSDEDSQKREGEKEQRIIGRPLGRFFKFSDQEIEQAKATDPWLVTAVFMQDYDHFIQKSSGMNVTRVIVGPEPEYELTHVLDGNPDPAAVTLLNFVADDEYNFTWQLWNNKTLFDMDVPRSLRDGVTLTERQFAQPGLLRQVDRSNPDDIAQVTAIITKILSDPGFDGDDSEEVNEDGNVEKVIRSRVGKLRSARQDVMAKIDVIDQKQESLTTKELKNRNGLITLMSTSRFPTYNMGADYGMPTLDMPIEEYEKAIRKATGRTALFYINLAQNASVEFGAKAINPTKKNAGEVLAWLSMDQGLSRSAAEAVLHLMVLESYK